MIGLAFALAILPVAETPVVRAGTAAFELRWDAPASCPAAAEIRAAIERHLATPLASPLGDGLRVDGVARERNGVWHVDLVMTRGDGHSERRIGGAADCAAASETAALVVAIAIDPDVAARSSDVVVPTPDEPTPDVPPPDEPNEPQPIATVPMDSSPVDRPIIPTPARPPLQLRAAVGARTDVTFGTLPRVGFGGTAFVDLLLGTRGRIGVGASIAGAPPLAIREASVRMLRWTVEVRGCPVFPVRPWLELVPCIGLQAGQTRADSRGLANERNVRHPWLAPTVQFATVFVPHPAIGVWLGLHGLVPAFRHAYEVTGEGVVHTTAPVAGGVIVGIEARFP